MQNERGIDSKVVNLILFGSGERRRYSQDTPILPDVWHRIAAQPSERHDLLITPLDAHSALDVMMDIVTSFPDDVLEAAEPAPLQSFVAMRLSFSEVVSYILPLTLWIHETSDRFKVEMAKSEWHLHGPDAFEQVYGAAGGTLPERTGGKAPVLRGQMLDSARVLTLIASIQIACEHNIFVRELAELFPLRKPIADRIETLAAVLMMTEGKPSLIWRVATNRPLQAATSYSRATIKADAAYRVFDVKCETITWAVLDSGIQHDHPAFMTAPADGSPPVSRVLRTYNMGLLRRLLNVAYKRKPEANPVLKECAEQSGLAPALALTHLKNAYQSYDTKVLDWSSIEPLLRVVKPQTPVDGHGTHVAGIIGANWIEETDTPPDAQGAVRRVRSAKLVGMCPDIKFMDFRILGEGLDETEFAVIGALQLVRYLNSHNRYIVVHGVNMSLSIPHEVENYACGRTPVCDECERLVGAEVTVVAAAGNQGYQKFKTEKGVFANYSAFSITDPGNAESVITVGSTHRREPHTYGISYFSSRGPTGDGRMKPDLVAPGERILSALPDDETGSLDGTSQAAPHVSAAAAMLMARYPELNRQPRRIKRLLCESATDLGRERSFQGHGLLDVLRALQSF